MRGAHVKDMDDVRRPACVNKCVIITGMSGAGRSVALKILEDRGFYAADNIPPILMPQLMEVLSGNAAAIETGVAVVVDIRGEALFEDLFAIVEKLRGTVKDVRLVYLDASDDWLVRRYETTRRRHPLGKGVTILEGIAKERQRLVEIREHADIMMDTSSLLPSDLRSVLLTELGLNDDPLTAIVSSFGFKYGVPRDCDYMFDVRFLPNPNYVPELKKLSGEDLEIQNYLSRYPARRYLLDRLESLLDFVLTQYYNTGKKQVHIAVGCTGGRHRSVAIAVELSRYLSSKGLKTVTNHRDIDREEP